MTFSFFSNELWQSWFSQISWLIKLTIQQGLKFTLLPAVKLSSAYLKVWGLLSYIILSDNFWSAVCVFHAHFWKKTHSFKICALKKRNDFRQQKRSNFRVEKFKTEENLSKFLNNMAYKTVTSIMDCVMKRKFM